MTDFEKKRLALIARYDQSRPGVEHFLPQLHLLADSQILEMDETTVIFLRWMALYILNEYNSRVFLQEPENEEHKGNKHD